MKTCWIHFFPCNITCLNSQWIAMVMWRCFQLVRITGTSCLRPGEWCNGTLWYNEISKNGLFKWNLSNLTWQFKHVLTKVPAEKAVEQTRQAARGNDQAWTGRAKQLESLENSKKNSFWGANGFYRLQHYATLISGNRDRVFWLNYPCLVLGAPVPHL